MRLGLTLLALILFAGTARAEAPHATTAPASSGGTRPAATARPDAPAEPGTPQESFEVYLTLGSALGLKSHPVIDQILNIRRALDPEGAAASAKQMRAWARNRIYSAIDALEELNDARPGGGIAILTTAALEVPAVATFIAEKRLLSVPVGGGLVLVTKPRPPAPRP